MELSNKGAYLYQYLEVINDAFKKGKTVKLKVIGASMYPTLTENDSVVLEKPTKLRKYDIILYRADETKFCLHRLVKIGKTLTAVGDNNTLRETVSLDDVVAKVQLIEKNNEIIDRNSLKFYGYFVYSSIRRLYRRVRNKLKRKR